ncbi:MAG: hypothetical protein HKN47_04685, partial [Pirellulaceae bacterium]|nr:hypothetical protein [Pirellulaceae bacterium]
MSELFVCCRWVASLYLAVLFTTPQTIKAAETTGPATGTLVIVGGGDRENIVFKQFVELAGGQ